MPITSQWWSFSEGLIQHDQDKPGVYELGNSAGQVVYIGSSNELRRRLREHLNDTGCIRKNTAQYRLEYNQSYLTRERQLYDEFVAANRRQPVCNSVRP